MTAWWEERMVILDLETTSADPEDARIVTAAVGYVSGGKPTDIVTLVSAVDVDIPADAAAIHGWTTERARREGQPPADVIDIILGYIDRRPDGSPVVVFNAPYDLTVCDREARRYGIDGGLEHERPLYVIDPMVTDRHLEKYRKGSRKLADCCRHYRPDLSGAHQAAYDAVAAARLAYRMGRDWRVVRAPRDLEEMRELDELQAEWDRVRGDLPALHEAQRRWAYQQRTQLEEYFHKGNPKKGVPPQPDRVVEKEWPVLPLRVGASA